MVFSMTSLPPRPAPLSIELVSADFSKLLKVMTEYVYPEHFGMATTQAERSEFKAFMEPVTHVYSKGMATAAEGAVSKVGAALRDVITRSATDPKADVTPPWCSQAAHSFVSYMFFFRACVMLRSHGDWRGICYFP